MSFTFLFLTRLSAMPHAAAMYLLQSFPCPEPPSKSPLFCCGVLFSTPFHLFLSLSSTEPLPIILSASFLTHPVSPHQVKAALAVANESPSLSSSDIKRLRSMLQCLELVQSLPATWHHRLNHCNVHLLQKPRLVLELLLMDRQVDLVKQVRGEEEGGGRRGRGEEGGKGKGS